MLKYKLIFFTVFILPISSYSSALKRTPVTEWEYLIYKTNKEYKKTIQEEFNVEILEKKWTAIDRPCINKWDGIVKNVWFRTRIPLDTYSGNSSIYIQSLEKPFNLYYETKLIGSNHCNTGVNFCGYDSYLFQLPNGASKKYLYFSTFNPKKGPLGLCFDIYQGEMNDQIVLMTTDGLISGSIALLGIFLALLALGFSFTMTSATHLEKVNIEPEKAMDLRDFKILAPIIKCFYNLRYGFRKRQVPIYFSLFSSSLSIWIFTASRGPTIKNLFASSIFWWKLNNLSLSISPIFLILFYRNLLEIRSRFSTILQLSIILLYTTLSILVLAEFYGIIEFHCTYDYLARSLPLTSIIIGILAITSRKKYTSETFTVSSGVFILLLCSIHSSLVSSRFISNGWGAYTVQYGLLGFLLLSFIAIVIRVDSINKMNARLNGITSSILMIAHDFAKPIEKIISSRALLRNATKGYGCAENVVNILDRDNGTSEYALHLADDLKYIGGKKVLDLKNIEIGSCIDSAIQVFRSTIQKNKIEIKTSFNHSRIISGDSHLITRLIFNLLNNSDMAINASSRNTIGESIYIKTLDVKNGDYLRIIVGNTGSSISKRILRVLFKELFTSDQKSTSGWGLTIVHKIITDHNGFIKCISDKNRNFTEFLIDFPTIKKSSEKKE